MSNVLKMMMLSLVLCGATTEAAAQDRPARESRARAEARRGWLGLVYGPVEGREWMAVRQVVEGSPAARAGVSAGDTVIAWNGRSDPLSAALADPAAVGETVRLRLRRSDRQREVNVVAAESPRRRMVVHLDGREGEPIVIRSPILSLDGSGGEIRLHLDSLAVHADSLHTRLRVMLRDSLGPILRRLEETEMPRMRAELERAQREMAREMPRIRAEAERMERELEREMPRIRMESERAERELAREMARVTVAGGLALGSRSVAGAEFSELNEGLADYFGTDRGVLVLRVAPDTPAARSGLRAGDVVVSAGGQSVERVHEIREAVLESRDRDVELVVVRRGARQGLRLRWE